MLLSQRRPMRCQPAPKQKGFYIENHLCFELGQAKFQTCTIDIITYKKASKSLFYQGFGAFLRLTYSNKFNDLLLFFCKKIAHTAFRMCRSLMSLCIGCTPFLTSIMSRQWATRSSIDP